MSKPEMTYGEMWKCPLTFTVNFGDALPLKNEIMNSPEWEVYSKAISGLTNLTHRLQ
jgi:hypothetical protein